MNKKILLQGFVSLSMLLFSCEKQDEPSTLTVADDAKISIDKNSQIPLKETLLSPEEIQNASCGEATDVKIFAGQHIDVGTLTVSNDAENLYVQYALGGDWLLSETHLFVGAEKDMPLTGSKNPKIGHFPYHGEHGLVNEYTFTIALSSLPDCFIIAAHAAVVEQVNGEIQNSETAFAFGENEFSGNRWGWYLDYCKAACEQTCSDSYAINNGSVGTTQCFLENGFQNWGWTNSFNYYELNVYQYTTQQNYRMPLFADAALCNTNAGVSIGYVEIQVFSRDENPYATITFVVEDVNYTFSEINLHFDAAAYPKDGQGNDTNLPEYYGLSSANPDAATTYSFENINWPVNDQLQAVYLIASVKLCTSN